MRGKEETKPMVELEVVRENATSRSLAALVGFLAKEIVMLYPF
jgi:hypothetical protein